MSSPISAVTSVKCPPSLRKSARCCRPPVPLPLEAVARGATAGRLREVVPLPGGEGELIADINPAGLFSALATGTGRAVLLSSDGAPLAGTPEAFRRVRDSAALDGEEGSDWVSLEMRVEPSGLPPGEHWLLARAEREDELAGRIEAENLAQGGACFILSLSAEGAEPPAVEEVPS